MKIYAVVSTDKHQVDYNVMEVWDDKDIAIKRASELTAKEHKDTHSFFYVVCEYELNKKHEGPYIGKQIWSEQTTTNTN